MLLISVPEQKRYESMHVVRRDGSVRSAGAAVLEIMKLKPSTRVVAWAAHVFPPLRHRIDRDVVMSWPDPAGGEQIVVRRAQFVHGLRDAANVIGYDPNFGEADSMLVQPQRDLRDIFVLGAARQDLVADHDQSSGPLPRFTAQAPLS